ncbi:putative RING finger protein [Wickerhamomyces ciferrii]|uniref:RING finger protein n=1 Tax=Wickerhamomyces ciferrii (strain ATCC 14091 / BCRC 22168 / CBS 111 / JCM 3599 / NBRC 0793 / NRRL Y-1031 F-60-10) TaxID=1206466 RepID=K0KM75_WICCF|nr:putative RING finger protein [Wickerhamomyces ciferrii]CCH44096.1 putative RING finger protein [Wickerhamomyces ciferrii]
MANSVRDTESHNFTRICQVINNCTMSSTIFYRFRSQKNTSRILFDGTGITVFDLKKEIINENKLGTGTDFDLRIYNNDTNEEYQDDTLVIPRSTSVVARRSPASKNGKGTASRYVTGKPKITKVDKNAIHNNNTQQQQQQQQHTEDKTMTEEERISLMFANQDDQWKQTQQVMSTATPVYNKPSTTSTNNNPDDVPPPGYMCYRCGSKDHWIKNCPTNDDPNWEGKRIKRTTGIPKTYLKTIEKPEDESTGVKSYMMNEEGKYVVQVADEKSWESYKKKVNKTQDLINDMKDIDQSLIDPITGKVFENPVITPCCSKNYSKNYIEDNLLESDFICPNCGKEDIYLDHLTKNEELSKKVDEFLDKEFEKRGVKRSTEEELNASKRQTIDSSLPVKPNQQQPNSLPPNPMGLPMNPFGLPFVPPFGMMPPPPQQSNQ